ncbi:unnamed protein product [Cylicocyclus nassatus]|uniref:Uncharacterized protein n=1 Tax=Cylicocyclus nassatus TaxID=53992 RepID=A0AA36M1E7_CYLNA|nr:unnamed protein product [Cylicocyclus nassatus]
MNLFSISFLLFSILMTSGATCDGQSERYCRDECVRKGHPSGKCAFDNGMYRLCKCRKRRN